MWTSNVKKPHQKYSRGFHQIDGSSSCLTLEKWKIFHRIWFNQRDVSGLKWLYAASDIGCHGDRRWWCQTSMSHGWIHCHVQISKERRGSNDCEYSQQKRLSKAGGLNVMQAAFSVLDEVPQPLLLWIFFSKFFSFWMPKLMTLLSALFMFSLYFFIFIIIISVMQTAIDTTKTEPT